MSNLQLVEKILYYMDEHLSENITFEHLAEKFGYSPFHFHRIFSAVTGQTIRDYLSKRRLTLAHQRLCETSERIVDICFEMGFSSLRTFNRAFKETFGMRPSQARKEKQKITYRDIGTIITGYQKRVVLEGDFAIEPQFVEREEFVLAGYRKHTREGFSVIGDSWQELKQNLWQLNRKNTNAMYGFEDYSEDFAKEPLQFYYMAAVEVEKDAYLPEGVYKQVVPKATYAVFAVNGNNTKGEIAKAFRYIYGVWLPNSDYCIDDKLTADFEYYDERWDCQSKAAQLELYIPVKRLRGKQNG